MNRYREILRELIDAGRVTSSEKVALEDVRERYGITDTMHEEAIVSMGYELSRFEELVSKTGDLEAYESILKEALVKNTIAGDRDILESYREEHGISREELIECLGGIGWTLAGYETVAKGGVRSVVPHYREMLSQVLKADMLSEAEDHLIQAYRRQKGISEMEHEAVLRELGATNEMYSGKRLLLMRKEAAQLRSASLDIESETAILSEKLAALQAGAPELTVRLAEVQDDTKRVEAEAREKDAKIFEIREMMRDADIRVEMARDLYESKRISVDAIALNTDELEAAVKLKNKEVQEMGAQIAKLSSFVKDKERKMSNLANNARNVSAQAPVGVRNRNSMPSTLVEDWAKQEAREKRMFRTAVIAVAASVLSKEESENIKLDTNDLYMQMKNMAIDASEWRKWLTEIMQKKKIVMYKNEAKAEYGAKTVKRFDNKEALEAGLSLLEQQKGRGSVLERKLSSTLVMQHSTLIRPELTGIKE